LGYIVFMDTWLESSLLDLYRSAVEAFPRTGMRQHSTHTVRVEHVDWVPFKGVGTLFVKGLCRNEGRKNECIVLFKGVDYREGESKGSVPIRSSDGRIIHVGTLSESGSEVFVRCSCPDFRWRFAHWNKMDKSLYGRGPRKYEAMFRPGSSNPEEMAGMCKHLMKMAKILGESGLLGTGRLQIRV
jgi:hypothetical protein